MPPCTDGRATGTAVGAVGANSTVSRLIAFASLAVRARTAWSLWKGAGVGIINAAIGAACCSFALVMNRTAALAAAVRAHRRWRAGRWVPFGAAAGWALLITEQKRNGSALV